MMQLLTFEAANAATRGRPVIDELIVASLLVMVVNFLILTFAFKKKKNIGFHIFVMVWSALAFLINVFLEGSSIKMPLTLVHTITFVLAYYFLLWNEKQEKGFKLVVLGLLMSGFYILSIMVFEGIYRSIVHIGDITMLWGDPSGTMQKYIVMLPIAAVLVLISYFLYRAFKKNQ